MTLEDLLQSRLLLVTGKGGTGKTTFAASLGVLAAARGKRTVVCEVDTQLPAMNTIFGIDTAFEPQPVREGLDVCNIRWDSALEAYLHSIIPVRRVVRLVLQNRIVNRFIDFTPGSQELVTLSIIGNLVDRYDLVVVDMPASGHAFSLLDILRSAMGLFRSGPIRKRTQELTELFRDPATRLVFVALAEEMVVNETIETHARMVRSGVITTAPYVFLNRATLPSLTDDERELLSHLKEMELEELASEFVQAGAWEDRLEQATARARDRLGSRLDALPMLVPPAGVGGVPRAVVGRVSAHLGREIGLTRRDLAWT